MVRIPSEYQEVEYLESNGAYINFPVNIQTNDSFRAEIKFQYLGTKTNNYWLAGDGLSKNNYQFEFGMWSGWYHSGDTAIYTVVSGSSHNAVIEASQEKIYTANVELNFRICQRNGFTAETDGRRVYYTRLFLNSGLLANFIPCYRKSDNEIGMYDTVSKTFFTNQGTGTFLKGNNVNYDTVNLMESRRRILLNTPHLESLTGSALSFKTDMASKLKECRIHFAPIQEGSGDPSPDNVRPVHGYDSITIYNGQTAVVTIPFPQTIYGGYVDLVNGEVVEEWKCYDMGDLDWVADTTEHLFAYTFTVMPVNENNVLMTTYCEGYYPMHNSSLGTIRRIIGNYAIMGRNLYKSLYFRDDSYSTGAEFKQGNAGNHIIVPLATPTTYSLDPVTIRTLREQNNIWSDANGNIELKFWTH